MATKKLTARIDYDFGYAGSLSVIPSYSKTTNSSAGTQTMTMGPNSTTYYSEVEGDGWEKGLEARMASSEDFPFRWILGVNVYKTKDEQSQVNENQDDATAALEHQDQWNEQETKAIYANMTYPVTNVFRATVGARQSWDENTTWNYEEPGKGGVGVTLEGSTMEYDSPNYFANMSPSRVPYDSDNDGVWDGTEEVVNIETGDVVSVEDTSDVRWQEAYTMADLSLVYADPEGKWSLTGYVKNVGNYAVKQFLDGMGNLMIGDPRTYGATLTVRF